VRRLDGAWGSRDKRGTPMESGPDRRRRTLGRRVSPVNLIASAGRVVGVGATYVTGHDPCAWCLRPNRRAFFGHRVDLRVATASDAPHRSR
jgi:hypothetical protein